MLPLPEHLLLMRGTGVTSGTQVFIKGKFLQTYLSMFSCILGTLQHQRIGRPVSACTMSWFMHIWAEEMMKTIGCFSASGAELHYEVLPESETSFSVTFQQPNTSSLAVCEYLQYLTSLPKWPKIKYHRVNRVWEPRHVKNYNLFRFSNNGLYLSNLVWRIFLDYMLYNFKIMT